MIDLKIIDTGIDCTVIKSIDSVQEMLDKFVRPVSMNSPINVMRGLTTNYSYNVVRWPGMEFLKDCIRKGYEAFTGIKGTPLYVQCWVTTLTTGQQITPHTHVDENFSKEDFVSGHFHVKVNESSFNYYGDEKEPVMNKNGQITVFSPYLSHYTDPVVDDERISVAFDIITEKLFNQYPDLINWVKI